MTDCGIKIRPYRDSDKQAVIQLWRACGLVVPWNNPAVDIERKQQVQAELFLVGELHGHMAVAVFGGYDGHRGWINYLAVAPEYRRRGLGRAIMAEVEDRLRALGCPKINLQVRKSNIEVIEFYQSIGFTLDPVVSMGKRLVKDPPFEE